MSFDLLSKQHIKYLQKYLQSPAFRFVSGLMVSLIAAMFSGSCAVPAYQKIDQQAEVLGFERLIAEGTVFRHVVYAPKRKTTGDTVHIYIDGDGVNWQWERFVKTDPTPGRALMLDLMGLDGGNALFIGRPCYFGLELDDACTADYWTYARYSEKVVSSMVDVIFEVAGKYSKVVLLGHSGGGALALLIAEQLPNVTAVVTVAGMIDTDAWTNHHGYSPLYRSINPATRAPLPRNIRQLHLLGGQDANIPPALSRPWIAKQPRAQILEIPGNSHMCCWNKDWAGVLRWIESND